MKDLIQQENLCCGCTACFNACPNNAIAMVEDKYGFLYAKIDNTKCLQCGKCKEVCFLQNNPLYRKYINFPKVYTARNNSDAIFKSNLSGGVFQAISDYILCNDGIVYGSAFNNQFKTYHLKADNILDCKKLRNIKYVQSDMQNTFQNIKSELENGKLVLFTGTNCQAEGLANFLGKSYKNLITVSFVCRGLSNNKIFHDYINYIEKKHNSEILEINYARKRLHIHNNSIVVILKNGRKYRLNYKLDIFKIFHTDKLTLRPSCFKCKRVNTSANADITIGDAQFLNETTPHSFDKRAFSILIVNTPKGENLLKKISCKLQLTPEDNCDLLKYNSEKFMTLPENYETFWNDYKNSGFDFAVEKYYKKGYLKLIREKFHNKHK